MSYGRNYYGKDASSDPKALPEKAGRLEKERLFNVFGKRLLVTVPVGGVSREHEALAFGSAVLRAVCHVKDVKINKKHAPKFSDGVPENWEDFINAEK